MRHRVKGRKLGRNASHRKAMFRNMAVSLIRTVRPDEENPESPKVAGRITTTVPKAKELRPMVEKLVTLAKTARQKADAAGMDDLRSDAERGSDAWKDYRKSEQWQQFKKAEAPYGTARRRAFAILRDHEAVDILFSDLVDRFADRDGGYTRVIRLAERRLGDAGEQAIIEFVGENDRERPAAAAPAPMVVDDEPVDEDVSEDASADEDEADEDVAEVDVEDVADAEASADEDTEDELKDA